MAAERAVIESELVSDVFEDGVRNANGAGLGHCFEPGGDVDPVTKNIVAVDDHVAKIDANSQFEPALRRDRIVDRPRRSLHFERAVQRVDDAREIRQQAIPCRADDPTAEWEKKTYEPPKVRVISLRPEEEASYRAGRPSQMRLTSPLTTSIYSILASADDGRDDRRSCRGEDNHGEGLFFWIDADSDFARASVGHTLRATRSRRRTPAFYQRLRSGRLFHRRETPSGQGRIRVFVASITVALCQQ